MGVIEPCDFAGFGANYAETTDTTQNETLNQDHIHYFLRTLQNHENMALLHSITAQRRGYWACFERPQNYAFDNVHIDKVNGYWWECI